MTPRLNLIRTYVDLLSCTLRGSRVPVRGSAFRTLHERRDLAGMIEGVKTCIGLGVRVIALPLSETSPLFACLDCPEGIEQYGTRAFERSEITLRFKGSYLRTASCASIVATVAHELSHVELLALRHPLWDSEEATELNAMVHGFDGAYVAEQFAHHDAAPRPGYLSVREVLYAAELIHTRRLVLA